LPAMKQTYALLRAPGSPFGESLASCLEERGAQGAVLDLEAPFHGEPVTVRPGTVIWQGIDLAGTAAVFVEKPVFAWPQPRRIAGLLRDGEMDRDLVNAEREARSLIASAIPTAGDITRLVNPPVSRHLAASPATTLDRLQEAGVEVHPWRLGLAQDDSEERLLLDVVGRDLWHEPERPLPGHFSIEPDRFTGEVLSVLVAGRNLLGGLRYENGLAWDRKEHSATVAAKEVPASVAEMAIDAVETLGLGFSAVSLIEKGDRPGLLWFEAGPDLAAWDLSLEGQVATGLADYLIAVANGDKGSSS